ncbi:probable carboxylesterase 15 [Diospyros lotus]|uniref:probable carboxylesterase 15 n=1 Tax=Diospyros lotus TaxID=55363 RepID=UPI0022596B49|nr:probable carboxylesterase 15 [Diospyros lotus]
MGSLPHVVEDCQGILQVYNDGSIVRSDDIAFNIPVHDDGSVVWKDCLYDKPNNLYLRLYKPAVAVNSSPLPLPVVFFIHGGGFCVGSRTWPNCQNCCLRLSSGLHALVLAPDYRLAPEHRLPAAILDSLNAFKWLQAQAASAGSGATREIHEPWLRNGGVDFERVFIVGDSSGGNIAHHMAVELGSGSTDMGPVRVRGHVLMAPFFGGTARTRSEAEGPPEQLLNLDILDRFWRLSLPVGETADHPFANPFGPLSLQLEPLAFDPILVMVGGSELLKDRVHDYAARLQKLGKTVDYVELEGQQHGFFTNEPFSPLANTVLQLLRNFMAANSN